MSINNVADSIDVQSRAHPLDRLTQIIQFLNGHLLLLIFAVIALAILFGSIGSGAVSGIDGDVFFRWGVVSGGFGRHGCVVTCSRGDVWMRGGRGGAEGKLICFPREGPE